MIQTPRYPLFFQTPKRGSCKLDLLYCFRFLIIENQRTFVYNLNYHVCFAYKKMREECVRVRAFANLRQNSRESLHVSLYTCVFNYITKLYATFHVQ